ncbi:TPA: hypothetical protein ACRNDK_002658 [Pseudomonas aeruginosa]
MNLKKLTIALISILAISSANAAYTVKVALDSSLFKSESEQQINENICTATEKFINDRINITDLVISAGFNDALNICYVTVHGIDKIDTVEQYQEVGNLLLNSSYGKYSLDAAISGYSDGIGRVMIWNNTVHLESFYEKN